MKVISLRQPWASLAVHGYKGWETRGWRLGDKNRAIIERDGLLIHASKTTKDSHLMANPPFAYYLTKMGKLPYGAIIGRVNVGRIISTEEWLKDGNSGYTDPTTTHEYFLGDYRPNRWAWELLEPEIFKVPIPINGSLSIWDNPPFTEKQILEQITFENF